MHPPPRSRRLAPNASVAATGLPMACMNLGGTTAVQFLATGRFTQALNPGGGKLSPASEMGAALLGG